VTWLLKKALGFLLPGPGAFVAVAIAAAAAAGVAGPVGHWLGEREGKAAAETAFQLQAQDAEIQEIKRQRRESEAVAEGVRQRAIANAELVGPMQERIDALNDELAREAALNDEPDRPDPCRVTVDDVGRVSRAWGLDQGPD
jgi:hypothetical protein